MTWFNVVLFIFSVLSMCLGQAKVYDCFPFFNELELLNIRLHELSDVVDYFVIVESIETQRGHEKPLYFEENKHCFPSFLHKIIHVAIRERHPEFGLWERENYQRNQIMRGLTACQPDDLIIISDADELLRPNVIRELNDRLQTASLPWAFSCHQRLYYYHLNRVHDYQYYGKDGVPWHGSVVTTYKHLNKYRPQYFRDNRNNFFLIPEAGWHFSYLGNFERVKKKVESLVEGTDHWTMTQEEHEAYLRDYPLVPIDDSYPQYIQHHIPELTQLGLIAIP